MQHDLPRDDGVLDLVIDHPYTSAINEWIELCVALTDVIKMLCLLHSM
jgi:hypothetical protein